jgi:hypothetical protein
MDMKVGQVEFHEFASMLMATIQYYELQDVRGYVPRKKRDYEILVQPRLPSKSGSSII